MRLLAQFVRFCAHMHTHVTSVAGVRNESLAQGILERSAYVYATLGELAVCSWSTHVPSNCCAALLSILACVRDSSIRSTIDTEFQIRSANSASATAAL